MRTPHPAGPGLLLAAALVAAPAVGGCWTGTSSQPALRWAPGCADRADDPETYGYCLYQTVGAIEEAEGMLALCTAAASWEERCRHTWVTGHRSGRSLETLLELCGSSDDCAFELLDLQPAQDTAVQLARCTAHAGIHANDCVGHALQRWYEAAPDEASFARIAPLVPAATVDRGAYWLGSAVHCLELGSCDQAEGVVQERCLSHLDAYEHSGEPGRRVFICPRATPMQGGPPPAPQPPRPPR